ADRWFEPAFHPNEFRWSQNQVPRDSKVCSVFQQSSIWRARWIGGTSCRNQSGTLDWFSPPNFPCFPQRRAALLLKDSSAGQLAADLKLQISQRTNGCALPFSIRERTVHFQL